MSANDSKTRPNILLMIPHDLGEVLGCYGHAAVRSPNLDRLAEEGTRLENCFCAGPECSPSRAALYSGLHPHACGMSGLAHFGWGLTEPHLAARLSALGYDCHHFGFQHEIHGDATPLGYRLSHQASDENGRRDHSAPTVCGDVVKFIEGDLPAGGPWFACAGFTHVHRPWPRESRFSPEEVQVPAYLPDLPAIREDLTHFYESIAVMDEAVGRVLDALKRSGQEEQTLVVFTTDHGPALPRAKATLYDPGLRVAMLLRWPGRIPAGAAVDDLISNVDFTPTVLDLLGEDVPPGMHGRSFAPRLLGDADAPHREAIFAELLYDVAYDPVHGVRTDRYKYIRSFAVTEADAAGADPQVLTNFLAGPWVRVNDYDVLSSPAWRAVREHLGEAPARPPREELYDLAADPLEQRNLAGEPSAAEALEGMRARLEAWMHRTDSPLLGGHVPPNDKQREKGRQYQPGGQKYPG